MNFGALALLKASTSLLMFTDMNGRLTGYHNSPQVKSMSCRSILLS